MRRELVGALAAISLAMMATGTAMAQDEDLRMGDDPAYFERVEVPEAAIAVSFPSDWETEIEMRYDQTQRGDPYSGYWHVASGHDDEGSCSVDWELYPDGSIADIASIDQDIVTDALGDESEMQITEIELPIGSAHRLDAYQPDFGGYWSTYEVGADDMLFRLMCNSESPDPDDWMAIAETLEWLPADARLERPGIPASEPRVMFRPEPYELERVEVPEAGIAMLMPLGWELEVTMEERELTLPPARADEGPALYHQALYFEGDSGDWCGLQIHRDSPLTLWEHSDLKEADYVADAPESMHVHATLELIAGGVARRIDLISATSRGTASSYLFDSGPIRYVLTCGSDLVTNPDWRSMADSIELLESEPIVEPEPEPTAHTGDDIDFDELIDFDALELEWIEIREAGVSMLLPPDWEIEVTMEEREAVLPEAYSSDGPITFVQAFMAQPAIDSEDFCILRIHADNPMSIDDQAAWEHAILEVQFPEVVVEGGASDLWATPGRIVWIRFSGDDEGANMYFFEVDGIRYEVQCTGYTATSGLADSIAGSLTPLEPLPPGVPEDALGWWESGPFDTVVNVSQDAVMRATCERALWIECADGIYEERIDCVLSEDPVDPSDTQGSVPAETVTIEGAACEWVSDFWLAEDGSEVWAESWSITVEPDGTVTGTSTYGPGELDCEEG